MERRGGLAIASALLIISVFIVALKLIQPASVSIYLGSEGNAILIGSVPGLYTFTDVLVVFSFAMVAGASATYILFTKGNASGPPLAQLILDERKDRWLEISKTLKDDEVKVYQVILENGGLMNQGDLVTKTELSKTTVSRTLDLLESKALIERRRRGMGNVILLK